MKSLTLTQQTVRCPLEDCAAVLTVQTDPDGYPSRRHLDVTTCSLLPSVPLRSFTRSTYFADAAPPMRYLCEVETPPCQFEVDCSKRCLAILNAAEPGAAEPIRCTSGVSDGMELARQAQSSALTRILWFYSA